MGLPPPGNEVYLMDFSAFFEYINTFVIYCAFGWFAGMMICAYSWLIIEGIKSLIRMLKLCFGRHHKEDTKHE